MGNSDWCGEGHLEAYGDISVLVDIGSTVPDTKEKFSLNMIANSHEYVTDLYTDCILVVLAMFTSAAMV